MKDYELYAVVYAIKRNGKRMEKLASIPSMYARREKARGYVVAESQRQHIKLKPDDVSLCVVRVVG